MTETTIPYPDQMVCSESEASETYESPIDASFIEDLDTTQPLRHEAKLLRNKENIKILSQLPRTHRKAWNTSEQNYESSPGINAVFVKCPTTSKLQHYVLNPYTYMEVSDVGTLDDLAALLRTRADWISQYERIVTNVTLRNSIHALWGMNRDEPEIQIQAAHSDLVQTIAVLLDLTIHSTYRPAVVVGGILADHKYDVLSYPDVWFTNVSGEPLIATEITTLKSFPADHLWYHDSRGVQLFSTMYAHNCPTFLLNQHYWKVLVENQERNAVFTFPCHQAPHPLHALGKKASASKMMAIGNDYIKAVIICLLSERSSLKRAVLPAPTHFDTARPESPLVRLSQFKAPSILAGYEDGVPIYSNVRILPREEVAKLEEEIAMERRTAMETLIKEDQ